MTLEQLADKLERRIVELRDQVALEEVEVKTLEGILFDIQSKDLPLSYGARLFVGKSRNSLAEKIEELRIEWILAQWSSEPSSLDEYQKYFPKADPYHHVATDKLNSKKHHIQRLVLMLNKKHSIITEIEKVIVKRSL